MWDHLTNEEIYEEIYVIVAQNFGHGKRNVKRYRLKDLLTPAQRKRVRQGSHMASAQAHSNQRHESRKDRRSRERDERRRKPHSKEWFVRFMARIVHFSKTSPTTKGSRACQRRSVKPLAENSRE